jgi:hypothetical protein
VLEVRRLELTPEQWAIVDACADLDRLQDWIRRAATVENADALLVAV